MLSTFRRHSINTPWHVITSRITGDLWGGSSGNRWVPLTKGQVASVPPLSQAWTCWKRKKSRIVCELRGYDVHVTSSWYAETHLYRCLFMVDACNFLFFFNAQYWMYRMYFVFSSLRWRHNGRDSISNHQPHDCLLNRLFRRRSKKTSRLRVTGLCAGNSPGTGEFPAQMTSNAENVSIWWRHHVGFCWSSNLPGRVHANSTH